MNNKIPIIIIYNNYNYINNTFTSHIKASQSCYTYHVALSRCTTNSNEMWFKFPLECR